MTMPEKINVLYQKNGWPFSHIWRAGNLGENATPYTRSDISEARIAELEAKLSGTLEQNKGFMSLANEKIERIAELEAEVERLRGVLEDVEIRAKRIREDKAVVGIEACFIERIARKTLGETK